MKELPRLLALIGVILVLAEREVGWWSPAPWLEVAGREMGVTEIRGPRHHPRILAYHAETSLRAQSDEIAWCSSFVSWCLARVGLAGSGSALARSWLDWGEELCEPRRGSIVVLEGEGALSGHVGFYLGSHGSEVLVLGGNQSDAVGIAAYPAGRVLGYRWPSRSAAPRAAVRPWLKDRARSGYQ
jgi:uncharacterized protein (TIGR02594 family)